MKSARFTFLLILLLAAAGAVYWFQTRPEIPVRRTLTNTEGKSIDANIVGKTGATIHLDRIDNGIRFELSESKLVWSDRWFVWRLPEQTPPPPPKPKEEEPEDSYIASRRQRIEELTQKRVEYVAEIESGSLSNILNRKRREDVVEVEKEIEELKAAIETHKARTRPQ